MKPTILLIHGAWLTPAVMQPFKSRYEAAGYNVLAPAWPFMDRPVSELRSKPDPRVGKLTLGKIVEHYAAIIDSLPQNPILVGHSYGGLIVQMLLDRGYGAAGVSIDPAPAAGIRPGPKALAAALPVFLAWNGWSRALTMKPSHFGRYVANDLPTEVQAHVYDQLVVPAPGRIYYQSVLGIGAGINWKNDQRAPLLLISAEGDRTVEPGMVKQNFDRYAKSSAITALKIFPGRSHALIAGPGWEEVADFALTWAQSPHATSVSAAAGYMHIEAAHA